MTNDNKEKYIETPDCHILIAIQRNKENKGGGEQRKVHRRIVRDFERDVAVLKGICKEEGGIWRIYRTVNKRSFKKANKLFQHRLIDDIDKYYYRVDSLWKTCLLKPSSRAEKKFQLDIDTKDENVLKEITNFCIDENIDILEQIESPNGYHVILVPFDVRKLNNKDFSEFVEVKKDGYIHVDKIGE